MTSPYKKIVGFVAVAAIAASAFLAGIFVGLNNQSDIERATTLFNKEPAISDPTVDFEAFWRAWNILNERYVSNDGPTDQEKVWGAISGLTESLGDPYTVFFPPEEKKLFESDINGEFSGVGMEIGIRDGILTVIAPLKDTPAFNAGMQSGDQVIRIDGESSAGLTIEEAVRLIRGEKGTKVTLTVLRENESEPLEISIIRDTIAIPTIDVEFRTDTGTEISQEEKPFGTPADQSEVYVIRLYNFSATSANQFRESLRNFVISGKDKLILDLRNNPGGFLESAVDMASWFLPAGKVVVRESVGGEEGRIYRSRGYDIFNDNLKMVILVNGGSASASEILAGALQEHGIATLVGTQTFGKGSVQELVSVTEDTSLKVTVARWLTPNGISISEGGLTPDVEVEITIEDINASFDPQLQKAIDILSDN